MTGSESEVLEFVADVLGVPAASISMDTAYESIPEWDSVMQLRLVLEIGERYAIEIPVDEIAGIRTLGGFYGYVAAR